MYEEIVQAYEVIARRLLRGKVVPLLGAGANLGERPPDAHFQRGMYLPSGAELAAELAVNYPVINGHELAQVSQYIAAQEGEGALYEELHEVFDADYPPTRLHRMLARLARHLRESSVPKRECLLCVTTNYDDALERAFQELDEPFDLITYIAEGRDRGLFRHTTPDGESTVVRKPNEYVDVRLDARTVIAKVHGAVDRAQDHDSFVITEDHYVDYISRADISRLFPAMLAAKLRKSAFLFLGYSLRDWNLRVMLYRLWGEQDGKEYKSWAIQSDPSPIDQVVWGQRGVNILPVRVESFIDAIWDRIPEKEPEPR
jgi:hypothetical protein